MFYKTKEVLKKLEFGVLEFFVGALMIIGLVGYFAAVPADLDWLDHTISFILFTYLFYKLNITSILFGKNSKTANLIIIISYFLLFFKDIISYTKADAFKFSILRFIDAFYFFYSSDALFFNLLAFYLGLTGIILASIYIFKKIRISHPSLLYAISEDKFKNNFFRFLAIFVALLGFYYLVYNTFLEWLEFVIDDPVIAVGIIFYIHKIAKHHSKFHISTFIYKVGDFSSGLYSRFISLFHYKKTFALAVSGLLILHALADLGVFAYSLVFLKENFYLEIMAAEHTPFLKLFLEDSRGMPLIGIIPLFIVYLFNALSLIIFLLIPVILWFRMFSQKEPHIGRFLLFLIYASAVTYVLAPAYLIMPLEDISIVGADVISVSVLSRFSLLDSIFDNKLNVILAVSLTSFIFGLCIAALSSITKFKREIYALAAIGGLAYYTVYLYYFFISLLLYFYSNILLTWNAGHYPISAVLAIFLALSILFYIGGFLMFLYEIVMEYHKKKWSEPMLAANKSQIASEVFKYVLAGVLAVLVLLGGYKVITSLNEGACRTEIAKFEIDLRNLGESLRYGSREQQTHAVPCKADKIYFFELGKSVNLGAIDESPIMKDSVRSGANNVFIIKEGEVLRSFNAGSLLIGPPYYLCLLPKFDKISFFAEGAGSSTKVESAEEQPECTFISINPSKEEALEVINKFQAQGSVCTNPKCPNLNGERAKINDPSAQNTAEHIEILRKFTKETDKRQGNKKTKVEIILRPKGNVVLEEVRFYETIPNECKESLQQIIEDADIEGDVIFTDPDPLIMWYFDKIEEQKKISYKVNKDIDDRCRSLISGLAIAQRISPK